MAPFAAMLSGYGSWRGGEWLVIEELRALDGKDMDQGVIALGVTGQAYGATTPSVVLAAAGLERSQLCQS